MKYLFFDIECSNCHGGIGKMCEFGYVLTDENFNIISQDDIPMSPGKGDWNRFDLTGRDGEKDIELAYEYKFYLSQREFPHFYKRIKKLVCDPDTICFAYSMGNDIRHLHNSCTRYKLEPFNYTCYDVQMFVAKYLQKKGQMNLENAGRRLVSPDCLVKLEKHLSRDDAKLEMMIFEAICALEQKTSREVLEEYDSTKVNSIDFYTKIRERGRRKRLKAAGHDLYNSLAVKEEELDKPENVGRRYNISGELKAHMELLKSTIELIQSKGGILCNRISKSDFFIVLDDKNKEDILKSFKHPFEGQVLTYQEFTSTNE